MLQHSRTNKPGRKGNKTANNRIKGRGSKRNRWLRINCSGFLSGKVPSSVCSSEAASLRAPRIHVTANHADASRQISSRRTAAVPRQCAFRPAGLPELQMSSSHDENTYKNIKEKHKAAAASCMCPRIEEQTAENNASVFGRLPAAAMPCL